MLYLSVYENLDVEFTLVASLCITILRYLFLSLVSFLFGLIGYLISLCISTTLAGYYGAMAGLGLSCIKIGAVYAVSCHGNLIYTYQSGVPHSCTKVMHITRIRLTLVTWSCWPP